MLTMPKTRYAEADDGAHIAYQVIGDDDAPFDVILIPPWASHVELSWENPGWVAFYTRLCAFSRLILVDKRGTGLSHRLPTDEVPSLGATSRAEVAAEAVRRVKSWI